MTEIQLRTVETERHVLDRLNSVAETGGVRIVGLFVETDVREQSPFDSPSLVALHGSSEASAAVAVLMELRTLLLEEIIDAIS